MKIKILEEFHPRLALMEFKNLPAMYEFDGKITMAIGIDEISLKEFNDAIGARSETIGSLYDCLTKEDVAKKIAGTFTSYFKEGGISYTSAQLPENFGMDTDVTHTGTMKRRLQAEGIKHDDFDQQKTVVIKLLE